MPDAPPLLRLSGITKRFGPLVANDGISLQLHAGEVLALLGENGAGKSTLMGILFGHNTPDAGQIEVDGRPLPPGDTRAALAAGIGMVHQHFTLADNLSVLDNIVLGTEPLGRWRSGRAQARARLQQVAQAAGLQVNPDARVADLSVGEQQRVEILKALYRGARVLVLDEPTSVLTPQEAQALFGTLRRLVADGLAVVFISHKLDEVLAIAHRVQVLRAGKTVAEGPTAGSSKAQLAAWMVGQAVAMPERRATPAIRTDCLPRLVVQGLCARAGRQTLDQVSLAILPGEVLGIAGVSGNGQVLLAETLAGLHTPSAGQLQIDGQPLAAGPRARVAQGLARVPEDRQGVGTVGELPVWENICAEALAGAWSDGSDAPRLSRWGWVRGRTARAHAESVLRFYDVRGATLQRRTRALSGGNVQKLLLGRVLLRADATAPRVVIAHQPTWGLDIGAVAFVHGRLRAATEQGAAVLLISDDLDELELLADRIAVIHHGRLGQARPVADWSREQLGLAMAGDAAALGAGPHPTLEPRSHAA